jgi:hypothetical protein
MLHMPLTGERAREYQREYKRASRRAKALAAKALAQAAGHHEHGRPVALSAMPDAQMVGRGLLRDVLTRSNLDLERVVGKVAKKLDATRIYGSGEDAITAYDNDAQLRACEIAIKLHERAGTIPTSTEHGPGGLHLTLVEVHYGSGRDQDILDVVAESTDNDAITSDAHNPAIPQYGSE